MKKLLLILAAIFLLGGCAGIKLVSDYDEVIDKGITEFAEQLNTHVKNMGDLGGTSDGTYNANLKTYNALESKLDVMIARASAASEGKGCKLEKKVFDRVRNVLKNDMPPEMQSSDTNQDGNSYGCNEKLLVLVKEQLSYIRKIHKETDKCKERSCIDKCKEQEPSCIDKCKEMSCLRPATAKSTISIANQSINAVSVVETAKKR